MIEIQAINYNGRPPTSELRGVFGPGIQKKHHLIISICRERRNERVGIGFS